jgi:hypothetical protein
VEKTKEQNSKGIIKGQESKDSYQRIVIKGQESKNSVDNVNDSVVGHQVRLDDVGLNSGGSREHDRRAGCYPGDEINKSVFFVKGENKKSVELKLTW